MSAELSRRSVLAGAAAAFAVCVTRSRAPGLTAFRPATTDGGQRPDATVEAGTVAEWTYTCVAASDPRTMRVSAIILLPGGRRERVRASLEGEALWRVRYVMPAPGLYRVRVVSEPGSGSGLQGRTMRIYARPGMVVRKGVRGCAWG